LCANKKHTPYICCIPDRRKEQAHVIHRAAGSSTRRYSTRSFKDPAASSSRCGARDEATASPRGVADLFRPAQDPLSIIRWKDIHEQLEEAVDACENAADVLEAILVKNRSARVDVLLVSSVVVALGFDFTNGFHDTANAVATSVSTRALSPRSRC
jgi:hypothetical protein